MSNLSIAVSKDDHLQGMMHASCSLVEYGDYECPSCGDIQPTIKRLQAHFGGQLSVVFRNFPLREIHPWAEPAAELAEFAGTQGKFWEMHDLLFANQEDLSPSALRSLCLDLGISSSQLRHAEADGTLRAKVDADFAGGVRSGVNGTPTFFLNGERYDGPTDFDSLQELIDQVLISNGD